MRNSLTEIGIEEPADPPKTRRSMLAAALCLTFLCAGAAAFYQFRRDSQLAACRSNLRTLESTLILYAEKNQNRLPARLSDPGLKSYLPQVPACPIAQRDTYSSGYEVRGCIFTLSCRGDNHHEPLSESYEGLLLNTPNSTVFPKQKFDKH